MKERVLWIRVVFKSTQENQHQVFLKRKSLTQIHQQQIYLTNSFEPQLQYGYRYKGKWQVKITYLNIKY